MPTTAQTCQKYHCWAVGPDSVFTSQRPLHCCRGRQKPWALHPRSYRLYKTRLLRTSWKLNKLQTTGRTLGKANNEEARLPIQGLVDKIYPTQKNLESRSYLPLESKRAKPRRTRQISNDSKSSQNPLENETYRLLYGYLDERLEQVAQLLAPKIEALCKNLRQRFTTNHQRDLAARATSRRTPSDVRCQLNVQQH